MDDRMDEKEEKKIFSYEDAIIWSEILGHPVCRKRRAKRAGEVNGNQSNVSRG